MKKIYFVRHGETESNIGNTVYHTPTTPLTQKGKSQVVIVAERFAKIPIDTIVSSNLTRAKETVEIIAKKIDIPVNYSDLFVEIRKPSAVFGKDKNSKIALDYKKEIKNNYHDLNWHYSDEESFNELKKRALNALKYLANRPEDNILVVTHADFLKCMIACVNFGDKLTREECDKYIHSLRSENTGVTILEYSAESKNLHWSLVVWNDHSHLDQELRNYERKIK